MLPDAPAWWAEAGSPGWNPTAWLGVNYPWVLAGHALGAWTLEEPGRAPFVVTPPGVLGMQTPLAFYDSVTVSVGADAPWRGYGGGLAVALGEGRIGRGARTIVDLGSGDFSYDENSLSIARADSLRWLRVEVVSGGREGVGGLGRLGRHLWGAGLGVSRGRHGLEAAYAQRGVSMTLAAEEEQAASGESGAVDYRYRGAAMDLGITLQRALTRHESLGALFASLREAQETRAAAELLSHDGALGFRMEARKTRVLRRAPDGSASTDAFDRQGRVLWVASRYERALGEGRARVELGAGRHGPLDRIDVAPALEYRFAAGPLAARLGVERVLEPVWTDVLPGTTPFLQSTWAGVLGIEAASPRGRRASANFLLGRTHDRALIARVPMEEIWLRLGPKRDPSVYDFALLSVTGSWAFRRFTLGGNGYALARSQGSAQPLVDPGFGFRSFLEWTHQAFGGDLGIVLRGELEGVGEHESQGGIPELCGDPQTEPKHLLPGYVTVGVTAGFTLAKALFTVRVRNLEDQPRPQPWIDCGTFVEALGPGREWRFALTARLAN